MTRHPSQRPKGPNDARVVALADHQPIPEDIVVLLQGYRHALLAAGSCLHAILGMTNGPEDPLEETINVLAGHMLSLIEDFDWLED
jgi:hypothetical protein